MRLSLRLLSVVLSIKLSVWSDMRGRIFSEIFLKIAQGLFKVPIYIILFNRWDLNTKIFNVPFVRNTTIKVFVVI